jgi:hypothetical protein
MGRIRMPKIEWRGLGEQCFFDPGKVKVAHCGICGSKMKVYRNALGPTCFAMAMSGHKRRHDHFECPNIKEAWHKRIYDLKWAVYRKEQERGPKSILKNYKHAAKKEILKLLKNHKAR